MDPWQTRSSGQTKEEKSDFNGSRDHCIMSQWRQWVWTNKAKRKERPRKDSRKRTHSNEYLFAIPRRLDCD